MEKRETRPGDLIIIVYLDHTVAAFRMNFDKYMTILMDAENLFRDQYAELVKNQYPEECQETEEEVKCTY